MQMHPLFSTHVFMVWQTDVPTFNALSTHHRICQYPNSFTEMVWEWHVSISYSGWAAARRQALVATLLMRYASKGGKGAA